MRKTLRRNRSSGSNHQSWRADDLWVIDLETTGLDVRRDEIVAYGAVPIRGGRIQMADCVYGMVGITDAVPAASSRIHCIRTQDLAGAPPLDIAVAQLDSLVGDAPIIAHCAMIERAFLRRAYRACGRKLRNPFIDTAPLATAALQEDIEGGVISLEYAATALGMPVHAPHHALGDAVTTANVFLAVASRIERQAASAPLSITTLIAKSAVAPPRRKVEAWPHPCPP